MNNSTEQISWPDTETNELDYDFIIACGYVFIQTAICAVGFVLNLINFGVFVQPTFTAPTYIMMTFLSLADAATLGFRIPQGYIFFPRVSKYFTDAVVYVYLYSTYVEVPFTNMSENISAWLTVALAMERYITMRHWSIAKHYFTPQNTRRLVLIIFLVAVVFNTPYFATQVITLSRVNNTLQLKSNLTSFYQSNYYATYSWLRIVLVQIIPLCFLCISNCLLFALVSQHNQRFSNQRTSNREEISKTRHGRLLQRKISTASFVTKVSTYEATIALPKSLSPNADRNDTVHNQLGNTHSRSNGNSPQLATKMLSTEMITPTNGDEGGNVLTLAVQHDPINESSTNTQPTNHSAGASNQRQIQCERSQKRRAAQKKLTILLIAVILLFLIGQVPQSLAYIRVFAALGICSTNGLERCIAHQFYRMITVNLSHLAFALTFFVYLFLNRDFRNTLVSCIYRGKSSERSRRPRNSR